MRARSPKPNLTTRIVQAARKSPHDGCFVAQDRGLRFQGQYADVCAGERATTELWNGLVPINSGVTVVLESPKCARATP
jgi:hypothetical protein